MAQTQVAIPEKIFFKIGEVCDIVDVQAHVLRYWETEFPMLSPQKNRSGQRTYRRRDVEMALRIKDLLYEDLYTIAGAKKRLQGEMRDTNKLKIVRSEPPQEDQNYIKVVEDSKPQPIEDQELVIGDIVEDVIETEAASYDEEFEFDDERKEAIKSLTSQLLELREMLKPSQSQG